ncbi:MAG: hypothetical protein WCG21_11795 [Eubacteriales bacterium]
MKLTIAEIRDHYRKATDKDAAIKELAASEEVSEQMIKFYVRGNTGPVRPTETPAQYITKAFAPVPKKRRGRPAKKHEADKKVVKTPKTVIEVPEIVTAEPDPVIEEPKPKDPTVQYTHFEPVTQLEREMFFADIADDEPVELQKPQMTLLGQEVKNFDDVTRVMQEAKKAKEKNAADNMKFMEEAVKEKVMTDSLPVIGVMGFGSPRTLFDASTLSARIMHNMRAVFEPKTVSPVLRAQTDANLLPIIPRYVWEENRAREVAAAIVRFAEALKPIPAEWVEEYNARYGV